MADAALKELEQETNLQERHDLIRYLQTFQLSSEQRQRLEKERSKTPPVQFIPKHSPKLASLNVLRTAHQELQECLLNGGNTLDLLAAQTEQIQRQHKSVQQTNEHLQTSNSLLTRMKSIFR